MKCPKCGYQSFNDLTNCKKCGRDLSEIQAKLNFGSPVVVSSPAQPRTADLAANTAEPTEPSAPAVEELEIPQQNSAEEDDEHLLEDFFQFIDTPQDNDQVPAPIPAAKQQPPVKIAARKETARKIPDEFPQWQQETPQGDFPFDELDADLDALSLSKAKEQALDTASPFDDVDSFEINWQLPIEENAAGEAEQTTADTTTDGPPPATEQDPQRELPATPKPAAITKPAAEPHRAEPVTAGAAADGPSEQNRPAAAVVLEPETAEEEWLLPELRADHPAEEEFALTEPGAAKTPAPDVSPSCEVQEELPLAAEATEPPAQPADIAGIFLPDTQPDSIASAARLLALRAKAYLADLGLLTAIFALFVGAGEIARSPASGERFRFTGDVLLDLAAPYFLVFFTLCFGYFTLFHYLSGQTPGKMLFNLRVEGDDHADITLAQAFLRCVGGLIALLPAGLGYLSIVLDGEQKGWNDRLAGCRVVMVEEPEED